MDIELWKRQKTELKLTYDDIARLSGVPKRTVCSIFAGEVANPHINNVEAIEKVLKIAPEQVEAYTYGLTDSEKILIEYFRLISPQNQLLIFNMLKNAFPETNALPIDEVRDMLNLN